MTTCSFQLHLQKTHGYDLVKGMMIHASGGILL